MRPNRRLLRQQLIALAIIVLSSTVSHAQERPTILAGHGTLSGSILPLWVGTDAKLFEKHGLQVRPIYLPRAAGRPALVSGDIQVYFSAGPPVVQMRLSGGDVAVTSCVVHKLTSKIMVHPAIQKVADLRGKVVAVANPGSASDFAAKLFMARQRLDQRCLCRAGQWPGARHLCVTAQRYPGCGGRFQAIAGARRSEHSLCRELHHGAAFLCRETAGSHAQLRRRHHRGSRLYPKTPE